MDYSEAFDTEHGRYEGGYFTFNEPLIVDGNEIKKIDFRSAVFPPGMTMREAVDVVISGFMDPQSEHSEVDQDGGELLFDFSPN